jgi:hypothetical protein
MWGDLRRDFVIVFGLIMIILFYLIIPMVCPGFPKPALSDVHLVSDYSVGSLRQFTLVSTVTNEGTDGNVLVRTKLINASYQEVREMTEKTIYMHQGDQIDVRTTVSGPADDPYDIVVEALRR